MSFVILNSVFAFLFWEISEEEKQDGENCGWFAWILFLIFLGLALICFNLLFFNIK